MNITDQDILLWAIEYCKERADLSRDHQERWSMWTNRANELRSRYNRRALEIRNIPYGYEA